MTVVEPTLLDLIEALRADQQWRWQDGERIVVEYYFALHPRLLANALGALQLVYRRNAE